MVNDEIISREAAYIYRYCVGVEPVGGNLLHWKGMVRDINGQTGILEIHIPEDFPNSPPVLSLASNAKHPALNPDGIIQTRTINRWRPSNHVYTVIKEAQALISSAAFTKSHSVAVNQESKMLENQVSMLRAELESKKRELQEIQQQSAHQVASSQDVSQVIEESLFELENEAYALEEAYDNLEIKAIDFAKQFVEARKRYYLIQESTH